MKFYLTTIPIILITLLLNFLIAYDYATYQTPNYTKVGLFSPTLPHAQEKEYYTITAVVSAYTLSTDETDETPLIGAGGSMVGNSFLIVACPRDIPLGTWVSIDNTLYRCHDRMALRNDGMFDILMDSKAEAFAWGKREQQVKVYY